MFVYFQPSPTWAVVWHDAIVALIAASGAYVTVLVNRKRRSTVRAEDRKADADVIKLNAESLAEIYGQLREARNEVATIVRRNAEEIKELKTHHAAEEEFLRSQIEIRTQSEYEAKEGEKRVRGRFHDAANEIQKCILRIRDYEEVLRASNPAIVFTPYNFKPYEEIMRAHEE